MASAAAAPYAPLESRPALAPAPRTYDDCCGCPNDGNLARDQIQASFSSN
jgi:hypothetical protein